MLNNKQTVFVEEYLTCWSATEAARRAGYKHPHVQGPRLLSNVSIAEEVRQRIEDKAMTADEVLARLASQARGDMGDFLDIESMSFGINLQKAKEKGLTPLIKKVKQHTTITSYSDGKDEENTWIELELYDAHAALVDIGKHLKLFTDLNVSGDITVHGFEDVLKRVYSA